MDCQGALNVAISNPDPNQLDIVCPVYGNMSYSPERCHGFNDIPFFSIHEISGNLGCKNLNVCFGNISEGLNNSRLDFFVSERTVCVSPLTTYTVRKYTRSFEIRGEIIIINYIIALISPRAARKFE